jgi:signal transduction histidine kinase
LEHGTFESSIVQHHETPLELLGGSSIYIEVYHPDKSLLTASENAHRFPMELSHLSNEVSVIDLPMENGRVRLLSYPAVREGKIVGYVQVGASLHAIDMTHVRLRNLLWSVSLLGLLVALVGGWLIASSALEPVTHMAQAARAVALSGNFSQRLPVSGTRDELAKLAVTFNGMLASLEMVYEQQRRLIDDASHELRAPLTSLLLN